MNLTFVDVFEDPAVVGEEVLVVLEELSRDSWMECVKVWCLKSREEIGAFSPQTAVLGPGERSQRHTLSSALIRRETLWRRRMLSPWVWCLME